MSYQWRKNGATISGATSDSYTLSPVQTSDAGVYSVKVVNAGGTVYSSNATLTVLSSVAIATQPQSQTVVQGQNVSFTVGASGTAPFSYQWRFNGTNLPGAIASTLTLTNVQTTNAGSYTVVVANAAGSVTSRTASLTVIPGVRIDSTSSSSRTFGPSATWSHTVSGSDRLLLVGVSLQYITVSSVTYGGVALTRVGSTRGGSPQNDGWVEIWRLVAPPTGTANVVVTAAASDAIAAGAMSFTGVHQSSPLGAFTGAAGFGSTPSVTVPSAVGEIVFDTMMWNGDWAGVSVGAGQTQRWNIQAGWSVTGAGSTEPGASSVTMSWSTSGDSWAIGGVSIKPSANDAPVANNDNYSTQVNVPLIVPATAGILTNDTDFNGLALTAMLVTNVSQGSLSLGTNGGFTYTPNTNFIGSDSFTYRASDGFSTGNVATVTINITPVNDPPVANNDTYTTLEDVPLIVPAASGILTNDTDVEGNAFKALLASNVTHGSLNLNTNGGFTYTPATNYYGADSFTYRAYDAFSTGNVVTVTINITPVNDASPVANKDTYTTLEDVPLIVPAASGILTNDTDVDGDVLTAALVSDVSNGTLNLNTNGSFTYTPDTNYNGSDSFTYRVSDGLNPMAVILEQNTSGGSKIEVTKGTVGTQSFREGTAGGNSYTISKIVLYVSRESALPSSNPTFSIGTGVNSGAMAGSSVTIPASSITNTTSGASFQTYEITYSTPVGPFTAGTTYYLNLANLTSKRLFVEYANANTYTNGTYYAAGINQSKDIRFQVFGLFDIATVTLTVTPVNDAPVAVNDTYTTLEDVPLIVPAASDILTNDTDVEGGALTVVLVSNVTHGSLNLNTNGDFTYTPNTNYNGSDSFTYRANDGLTTGNVATVTINITPVNDPPVANNDVYTTLEDVPLIVPAASGIFTNDTDVDGDALTALLVSNVTQGTLNLNPNGGFTYTPSTNYNGSDSFTYRANDGTANGNLATVIINITPVYDPVIAVNDSTNTPEDASVTVKVLANDYNPDGLPLTLTGTSTTNGTAVINGTNIVFTPSTNFNGTVVFSYTASDGTNSATANVTVTVNPTPPSITSQPPSQAVSVGQAAAFSVGVSGTAPLRYRWRLNGTNVAGATNALLSLANVQTTNAGSYSVVVTNIAGSATSMVATLTVYMPPTITNQPASQAIVQGQNVSFSVSASGTSPFSYQWSFNGTNVSGATNASLALANIDQPDAGSYSVVVINLAGFATSAVAALNVLVPAVGSYFEAVATNNPLAYWRLGELSGTSAFDCIGGNNATYNNVTLNQPSALATDSDPSAAFNGTSAYAGTSVSLANNLPEFTLEGWFKLTAATARMGLWGQNDAIELGLNTKTTLQIYTAGGGSLTVTNIWATNSWHHIAAIGNGTNLLLFVDGNLAGTGGVATTNYGSSTYPFNIGGGGVFDATTNWFNGGLDEVAFYGQALAATDIKRHCLLGLALPTLTLTAPTNNATFTSPATINLAATVVTNGHTIAKVQFFNGATLLNEDPAAPYTNSWSGVGAGTYNLSAVVIYDTGSVTSSVAMVTVFTPPSITTQPQSLAVIKGQDASFTVVPSGSSPFTYQWYFNSTSLGSGSGAQTATLTVGNIATGDAGNYWVAVSGPGGSVTSLVATLTVYVPPSISTQPANKSVVLGQAVAFSVTASGSPAPSCQWNVNGTNLIDGPDISGSTSNILTLSSVQTAQAGNVFVVITNYGGSVTSSVRTLTVNVPAFITNQPQSLSVTQNQTATFSVGAGGTATVTYQWYFNSVKMGAGSTSSTLTLSGAGTNDAGSYTVVAKNTYGSATSVVATLTVYVPPTITSQPASQTILQGQNVSFSVGASGTSPFSYQWRFNGTNLAGATSSTLTLNSVQASSAGSYTVVVTNIAGSVTSVVATLTFYVPPSITTQPLNQVVVNGQNASFSVVASGTSPFSYKWKFNGSTLSGATNAVLTLTNVQTNNAGSYSVIVTNVAGSVTSSSATLTVNVPASITTQPLSQTVTTGSNVVFSVVAGGTAPFSYQWTFNGTNLAGANSSMLFLTNVQTTDAGSYSVVVTNIAGSATSALATLTVNVPPAITNQPQSQTLSMGQAAAFCVGADGTATLGYQWCFNGTALSGATNAALALTGVHAADAGSYTVVVTNIAGLVTSVAATLTVTNPVINLSVASGAGTASTGFTFQASVPAGATYVVLASTDFQDWTPISTNVAPTGSVVAMFTDITAATYSQRYYKVMVP